ncbi:MAG: MFS transporter [Bacteroidales bacterium]|nr:MFS transporter [Bacteroidales bacterium]
MKSTKHKYTQDINLRIIFSITLIAVMGVSTITPVLPDVRADLGLTNQQTGLMIVFFSMPGILLTPLLGILADRTSRKVVLIPSLIVFALAGFVIFFLRDFGWILFFRVLQGAGASSLGSLNSTLVGDIYLKEERSKVMGYVAAVLSVGTAAYPAIGGALAILGWHFPFLMPLFALPVAWFVYKKLDNPEPKREGGFFTYLKESFRNIQSVSVIVLFISSFVVFIILFGGYLTYLPLLMNDKFQSSSFEIGMVLTSMSVITAFTSMMLGRINRRFSERTIILIGFGAYVVAFTIIPFITHPLLMIIPIIIFGFGHGVNFPSIQSHMTKLAPLKYRGMFMSFNGMVLRIGQTTGPLIIGSFYLINGHLTAFLGAAALALIMFVFLFYLLKM